VLVGVSPNERAIAEELIENGQTVVRIATQAGKKTADFLVDGIVTEVKTLTAAGPNTLKNALENAALQSSENILIDARRSAFRRKTHWCKFNALKGICKT
jgi:hypothetical protein